MVLYVDSFLSGKSVEGEVQCFTDSSRYKSRTWAGYRILIKDQVVAEEAIPLEIFQSVFQAKVVAILSAAEKLMEFADRGKIVIHSDSQAALQVLNNPVVTSQTVLAAMLNLDTLAEKQVISLRWVKAHVGLTGNEKADSPAKRGSQMVLTALEPLIPVPSCQLT
jgi:ribonuclease HI